MLIDLHNHTGWGSGDSHVEPPDLIEQARRWGLDGIAITEHEQVWDPEKVAMLRRRHEFAVLAGVEVQTASGHILVFGLSGPRRFSQTPTLRELRAIADAEGALIAVAHPFDAAYGVGYQPEGEGGADWEELIESRDWQLLDAVESCNGRLGPQQRALAEELARRLDVPTIGGSDTHRVMEVARCFTVFDDEIHDEQELIAAIRSRRCHGADWASEGLPDKRSRDLLNLPDASEE